MSIQTQDLQDILYRVAANYTLRLTDPLAADPKRPPLTRQMVATKRGQVRFAELVHQNLRQDRMSLNHLVIVTQEALAKVRHEVGNESDEYKGALFVLSSILGFAKGAWNALTDSALVAYSKA